MKLLVDVAQMGIGDVGINLGRGDGGVAEHGLDAADVGAIYQEIGGKGMTKGMR